MRALVLGTLVALAGTASAQPGITEPVPVAPVGPHPDELNESTAMALSLGGTVASWALLLGAAGMEDGETFATVGAAGAMFAPSLGHWYAGSYATRGLGLRVAGVGATFVGLLVAFSECPLFSEEDCDQSALGPVLMLSGVGLFIGGTIDDIATAPRAVRRHNARLYDVTIVPAIHRESVGFGVNGRF